MIDFLFGALFIYAGTRFVKHYKTPAKASRADIKMMAILIMVYTFGYGAYRVYLAFGGTPWAGM
jgi:hypothetical protein